jgi:Fe(3+) dicitrate transport protein
MRGWGTANGGEQGRWAYGWTAVAVVLALLAAEPALAQGGPSETANPDMGGPTHASTVVVSGRVTAESTGEELSGVAVEVAELRQRRLTDARGRFAFGGVPAGTYTLRFQRMGLAATDRTVVVRGGEAVSLEIVLGEDAVALAPVRVLLERTRMVGDPSLARQVPGSAHVIDSQALADAKLPFDDAGSLLRRVPGVNIQDEEGYGRRPHIGLRGTGTERSSKVTVMEDGVLIAPAPYSSPAAYVFPVVGRMEAIEVRKGSSQVKYGPRTVGGAVNLVTASVPSTLRVDVDVAGGQDATGKLVARAGDSYRYGGWVVETYQLRTDGFKDLDGPGHTGFRAANYMAKARVNTDRESAGAYQELELKLNRFDEVSNETYMGLTDQDFLATPLRRYAASQADVLNAEQSQIQLRHFARPNQWLDITTAAYRNDVFRNWYKAQSVMGRGLAAVLAQPETYAAELAVLRGADSEAGALRLRANHRDYYAQGIQSTLGLRFRALGARHDVEVGVRFHEDAEDRVQHEDAYAMAGGRMVLTEAGGKGTQENRLGHARARAIYVQNHLTAGRVTLTPGVRHESIQLTRTDWALGDAARGEPTGVRETSVDVWIPGVGGSLLLTPSARLFAGVHKGFGPPGPGAHAETKPETSVSYEVGTDFHVNGAAFQLVGFYSDYDNILGASTLSSGGDGSGNLHNGGAVDVMGIEALVEADLLGGRSRFGQLPARLAYTWTRAEFRTDFTSSYSPWGNVTAGDRLPYLPEHQLHASIGLDRAAWKLRLTSAYNGPMRTLAGQGERTPEHSTDAFLVWNLSGEYAATPWAAVYGAVQNLTDERYVVARQPAGVRPGLPRTIQLGVRVRNW